MQTRMTAALIGLLLIAGAVFVLNDIAQTHFLYWRLWWFDIMMHFLGGVAVGGLTVWLALRVRPLISPKALALLTLASILVIGVGWEVFEYATGMFDGVDNIVGDTVLDIIMDIIGAFTMYACALAFRRSHTALPDNTETL